MHPRIQPLALNSFLWTHTLAHMRTGNQCSPICEPSIKAGMNGTGHKVKLRFIPLKDKQCQDVLVKMFSNDCHGQKAAWQPEENSLLPANLSFPGCKH